MLFSILVFSLYRSIGLGVTRKRLAVELSSRAFQSSFPVELFTRNFQSNFAVKLCSRTCVQDYPTILKFSMSLKKVLPGTTTGEAKPEKKADVDSSRKSDATTGEAKPEKKADVDSSVSAICILRAFNDGYPVVGWCWWSVSVLIMFLQGWIFYFGVQWSYESSLDEKNHDHQVKLPDGTILQTTQNQDFSWDHSSYNKMEEKYLQTLYTKYRKNHKSTVNLHEPDFDATEYCDASIQVMTSYGDEMFVTNIFYSFCIVFVLHSFFTNVSHGVVFKKSELCSEFCYALLVVFEGFQVLMINVMLYNTLWSIEGLDIVYNAFAIIFIVDLDENFLETVFPKNLLKDVEDYYEDKKLMEPNWYLNTETFDIAPECLIHNKKCCGNVFTRHTVLKALLLTCFVVNFICGSIPIMQELNIVKCQHNEMIDFISSGEWNDGYQCKNKISYAKQSWTTTSSICEGVMVFCFAFSTNIAQHAGLKSARYKTVLQFIVYALFVYGMFMASEAIVVHFEDLAKRTGGIKYGTWMMPEHLSLDDDIYPSLVFNHTLPQGWCTKV